MNHRRPLYSGVQRIPISPPTAKEWREAKTLPAAIDLARRANAIEREYVLRHAERMGKQATRDVAALCDAYDVMLDRVLALHDAEMVRVRAVIVDQLRSHIPEAEKYGIVRAIQDNTYRVMNIWKDE